MEQIQAEGCAKDVWVSDWGPQRDGGWAAGIVLWKVDRDVENTPLVRGTFGSTDVGVPHVHTSFVGNRSDAHERDLAVLELLIIFLQPLLGKRDTNGDLAAHQCSLVLAATCVATSSASSSHTNRCRLKIEKDVSWIRYLAEINS